MARYAIYTIATGKVLNLIEWDGAAKYAPPAGCDLVRSDEGDIGDTWDGSRFVSPAPSLESLREAKRAELEAAWMAEQRAALIAKLANLASAQTADEIAAVNYGG